MGKISLECDNGICDIRLDDEIIGFIEGSLTTLTYVEIEPEYQGNGYGREAVEEYIRKAEEIGVKRLEKTTVTHGAMIKILETNGLKRCSHDPTHFEADFKQNYINKEN